MFNPAFQIGRRRFIHRSPLAGKPMVAQAMQPCTCAGRTLRKPPMLATTPPTRTRANLRFISSAASRTPIDSSSTQGSSTSSGRSRHRRLGTFSTLAIGLSTVLGAFCLVTMDDDKVLSPDRFIPLRINKVNHVSSDTAIFEVELPSSLPPSSSRNAESATPYRIHSIFVKQPDLQIQRPYTPLVTDFLEHLPSGSNKIQLLVKRYNDGEVSRYMHRLGPGDSIQVRGPVLTTELPTDVDNITFIVGGTGVTPAHQFVDALRRHRSSSSSSSSSEPKVTILYASSDPVLADALERMKRDASFPLDVKLFSPALPGPNRITREVLQRELGPAQGTGKRLIVVCGPEGMINAIAGPRARDLSQGPVRGILGDLGYSDHEVIKL